MLPRAHSIDELLLMCDPRARKLAEAARQRIVAVVPHATERLRAGWGLIGYKAPAYFAFIVLGPDQVRIGFEWGVDLADPSGLLEGSGKQVRYVAVRSEQDLLNPALAALLAAAALPPPPVKHG
jgi:hypothetical protein